MHKVCGQKKTIFYHSVPEFNNYLDEKMNEILILRAGDRILNKTMSMVSRTQRLKDLDTSNYSTCATSDLRTRLTEQHREWVVNSAGQMGRGCYDLIIHINQ